MLHILFDPPFTSETSPNQMYPLITKSIFLWRYLFRVRVSCWYPRFKIEWIFSWIESSQFQILQIETSCCRGCCETLQLVRHYWDKLLVVRLLSAFFCCKICKIRKDRKWESHSLWDIIETSCWGRCRQNNKHVTQAPLILVLDIEETLNSEFFKNMR